MIEVRNLIYEYSDKRILKELSFKLSTGSLSALVGQNGSGKSTLLECIAGIRMPHSGEILINGIDIVQNPRSCNHLIGFLPTFYGLYENYTIRQNLTFFAESYKIPASDIAGRVDEIANMIELKDSLDCKIAELSRGLRQRVAIAQTIIHKPKVLLLEKPSTGLDHVSLKAFKQVLKEFRDQDATIIIISQICDEYIVNADNLLVLKNGNLIFTPKKEDDFVIYLLSIHSNMSDCIIKMNEYSGVRIIKKKSLDSIYITFENPDIDLSDFLKFLISNGVKVLEFYKSKTWLESLCDELK